MTTTPREPDFAKRALGSAPNPLDNIDHVFRHTARRTWLGVVGLALLLAAGVIWTTVAEQKVVVEAAGVIAPADGVYTAGELQSGLVEEVLVSLGQEVRQGEALARVRVTGGGTSIVRSPVFGSLLAVDVRAGENATPGAPMFRIVPPGKALLIAIYPASDVSRLEVGQSVSVVVNGVAVERFGRAVGRVVAISPIPASESRLRQVTGDTSLVTAAQRLGPVREVQIALVPAGTASGVAWDGGVGPAAPISVGTRAVAQVTVGSETLLQRAFD